MPTPKLPPPQPNPSSNPHYHPWVKRPSQCSRNGRCIAGSRHTGTCIVPPRG